MKKILIIILVFPIFCKAQDSTLSILPEVDGIPDYSEVVSIDTSLSIQELYNRARIWFVKFYTTPKKNLQIEDKEAGLVVGKGIIPISYYYKVYTGLDTIQQRKLMPYTSEGFILSKDSMSIRENLELYHVIKIYFKKGRYKFEVTELHGIISDPPVGDFQAKPYDFEVTNRDYKPQKIYQSYVLNIINNTIVDLIYSLEKAMTKSTTGKIDW